MAKLALSLANYADASTLSGGSWLGGAPLANLQQPLLSLRARSVDALVASTKFNVDLGNTTIIVRFIGLARHNLTLNATYRIRAGTTAGASDLYDSTALAVWPAGYLPEDLEWEADNFWTGQLSAADVDGYPISLMHDCGANVRARYWTIEFTDTANPDGYVELARLWLGPLWSPQRNYAHGSTLGWEPRSISDYSLGGVKYSEERPSARVMKLPLPNLTTTEAFGAVLDAQRRLGTHGELWVLQDPADLARGFKRNFLATFRAFDPIARTFANLHGTSIEMEERL